MPVIITYVGGCLDSNNVGRDDNECTNNNREIIDGIGNSFNHYEIPIGPFCLYIDTHVTQIDRFACDQMHTMQSYLLTEIKFSNCVTKISECSFRNCSNLQRVELPEGLIILEDGAFSYCTKLQEIVIPGSVRYVGTGVFFGCTALNDVVFDGNTQINLQPNIFARCSNLRSIKLPLTLHSVPLGLLCHCRKLTTIILPSSIMQIGEGAFAGSGIQSMGIVDKDDVILLPGTVILPQNLKIIPQNCFSNCKLLTNIQIPLALNEIKDEAFLESGLQSITIPYNVQLIGASAWKHCLYLKKVTIYSTKDLYIADNIFANCPSLSVILMYQWLWPKVFESMNNHREFLLKFFQLYQTQICEFATNEEDNINCLK